MSTALSKPASSTCIFTFVQDSTRGVFRNHPVRPSIYLVSTTPPSPKWIDQILIKLSTLVVYNLRMCMKEDSTSPKTIKEDS